MTRREYLDKRNAARKEAGLCCNCGKNPAWQPGAYFCEECKQKHNARSKVQVSKYGWELQKQRKCRGCTKPLPIDCSHIKCDLCRYKHRIYYKRIKAQAIQHFGGKCVRCGESDVRCLVVHHINQDGNEHRKEIFGYNKTGLWLWVELAKSNFETDRRLEVLCSNCHLKEHSDLDDALFEVAA